MVRYIDADRLLLVLQKNFGHTGGADTVKQLIDKQPTADVVEVKHGEWIKHSPDTATMNEFHKLGIGKGMSDLSIFWTCSCCDSWGSITQNYCPNCGVKMDGGDAE